MGRVRGNSPAKPTNCKKTIPSIKGKGVGAVAAFRVYWGRGSSAFLAEPASDKESLLECLRKELIGSGLIIPFGDNFDDILRAVGDGSYPVAELKEKPDPSSSSEEEEEEGADEDEDEDISSGVPLAQVNIAEARAPRAAAPKVTKAIVGSGAADKDDLKRVLKAVEKLSASVGKMDGRLKSVERTGKKDVIDLGRLVEERSEGRVRGRGAPAPDDDPSSSSSESSSSDDEESRRSRRRRERKKRKNKKRRKKRANRESSDEDSSSSSSSDSEDSDTREFWAEFAKVPFKTPRLTVKKGDGDQMLRRALENYPTVSGYVNSLSLKQKRNKREAAMLARMLDFNIGELGVKKARQIGSTEIAIRRLVAITYGDQNNDWAVASQIEDGDSNLLTAKQRRKMLQDAKLAKQFALLDDTEKPAGNKKAGRNE